MKNWILGAIAAAELAVAVIIFVNLPPYLRQAGILLILGIWMFELTLTFAAERFLVLMRAGGRGSVPAFIANVKQVVHQGDLASAIESCKQQGGSLANVIGAGLEGYRARAARPGTTDERLEMTRRALQEASALESPNLERNLTALSTIASIATLIGLLGTTIGMIRSFQAMSHAGAPDATQLALGISEALVNTAMGLITAILATTLYNFFTTRVDTFNDRVEETSYEVLKLLEHKES